MELQPLVPADWDRIARALIDLTAFVGLALTAAFGLLLAYLIGQETLIGSSHANGKQVRLVRRAGQVIAAVAGLAMLVGLGRSLLTIRDVVPDIYPRLLI
jgi:hypothetical protein